MEIKKSTKADLENQRSLYIEIGLVVTLALSLVAFEWTTKPRDNQELLGVQAVEADEEQAPITRQQMDQPPPPPPPQVIEVINIVEDDVEIDEVDFETMEADDQTEFDFTPVFSDNMEEEAAEEEVFFIVEDMPSFQGGGSEKFREWILENMQYPSIASENGISGRVFVQFAVNSKGEVTDVVVVRGVDPALDKEAVRVVKSSPKWEPGKQRGRPVKVQFTFPIVFVLQ